MNFFNSTQISYNQSINLSFAKNVILDVKREDQIHPYISGNKFRKLKYNILEARSKQSPSLLTFGGAFSNHIAAVAEAGKLSNINTIGVIRGEELSHKIETNPTLKYAKLCGMKLIFVSRADYKLKNTQNFINKLKLKFGDFYLIPEGGTNNLAIKGCEEILQSNDKAYDFVCCSVGTGGTISGIINSTCDQQKVLGFSSLKGDFLNKDISKFANTKNWELITDYHFGGYGKINDQLITFINSFKSNTNIQLDPIYTGKMFYGLFEMIKNGYFKPNTKILAIHTGGLQGISGMNLKLKQQNKPLITLDQ